MRYAYDFFEVLTIENETIVVVDNDQPAYMNQMIEWLNDHGIKTTKQQNVFCAFGNNARVLELIDKGYWAGKEIDELKRKFTS